MNPIKHTVLDCETFDSFCAGKVDVKLVEDLCYKVPHGGYGGASKSSYANKTGKTILVLERNDWYSGDAYANDVWLFEEDFTADEAAEFIKDWDKQIRYKTATHVIIETTKSRETAPYKAFKADYVYNDEFLATFATLEDAIKWADAQ